MKFEINDGCIVSFELDSEDEIVKEITIPDGVTNIFEHTFTNLNNLETVIMPDSVIYVDIGAFASCHKLKTIKFSKNLTHVEDSAFEYTKWLNEQNDDFIIINDNILYMYRGNERNVVIPECIKYISPCAFTGNYLVESITMSDNVLEIGYNAFDGCTKLESIRLSENLKTIEEALFNECFNLKEITIPDSVTEIGYGAFHNCSNLKKIIFPKNCIDISPFVFNGTKWINNSESDFIIINELLYKYVGNQSEVIIPDNIKAICDSSFSHNKYIKSVVMSDNVKKIGKWAFNKCENLKRIQLSENIPKIECNTFFGCTSLESIEIPSSVKEIEHYAFYGCIDLKEVKIHGKPFSKLLVDNDPFRQTGLEFDWIINPKYDKFNLSYSDENKEFCFSFHSEGKSENYMVNAIMPHKLEGYEVFRDITTGKYGYKNKIGEIVIKPEYDIALPFNNNGFAVVITEEYMRVIDVNGKFAITTADFIRPDFMDKVAAIRHHRHQWGFINMKGNLIVDCIFEEVSDCIGGFAAAKKDGKWGLIRLNFGNKFTFV